MPSATKTPLPITTRDRYHARPSDTEPGMWTILQQEAGKTWAGGFARAFHVQGAARILAGLEALGYEVETIKPAGEIDAIIEGVPVLLHVFADGSVFHAESGVRLPKKDHAKVCNTLGATVADVVAAILQHPVTP